MHGGITWFYVGEGYSACIWIDHWARSTDFYDAMPGVFSHSPYVY
jgi:hypothetical protein